ncbi:MAG: methyltransferase domain-containing protein [Methanoregula sp.]|nr:methyltransferase domain-containing protein [Methanoregula sp.]
MTGMVKQTISSEFRNVDSTQSSDHLVQYLEYADSLPETRQIKVNSYGYLGLKKGDVVLDAGCGPGYDALRMAAIVGRSGKVTGIDLSERMIAIAQEKTNGSDLPVSFRKGDIRKLDVVDATFDAVRVERMLQILDHPGQILDELVRVLRPGGKLVAIEPDWEMFVVDPGSRDTARKFFRFCANQFPDGSTGRKLYRYLKERTMQNVTVHPEPLILHDFALASKLMNMEPFLAAAEEQGVLARDEIVAWQRELKEADTEGRFTFVGMMFAVEGRKGESDLNLP